MRGRLKRLGLAALMTVIGVNMWTGSPLFAVWVGSQVQGSGPPKMESFVVVAVVLLVVSLVLVRLLAVVGAAYDDATGKAPQVSTHAPWLRSMRGERALYEGERASFTGLEKVLIAMVVVAVLTFEVWFFLFAGSPIGAN